MSKMGPLIWRLREERGWTLGDLAEKVGISYQGINLREHGATRIKAGEEVKFASAFGMTVESLRRMAGMDGGEQAIPANIPILNRVPASAPWDYTIHPVRNRPGYAQTHRLPEEADEDLFAIEVVGEAGIPAVCDGDVVIFHPIYEGIPLKSIDRRVVFASFKDGTGDCLGQFQLTGLYDPERGDQFRIFNVEKGSVFREIWQSEVSRIAAAKRLHRPL